MTTTALKLVNETTLIVVEGAAITAGYMARAEAAAIAAEATVARAVKALGGAPFLLDFAGGNFLPGPASTDLLAGTALRLRNHFLDGRNEGLLCEGSQTQLCYKTDFAGAVAGGGAKPTYFGLAYAVGGLNLTTVTLNSDGSIDIRIAGTPSASGVYAPHFLGSSAGLAIGDKVTGSFEAQRLTTATGVVSESIIIYESNAAFSVLGAQESKTIVVADDVLFGHELTRTITTDASNVTHLFGITVLSGVPVDVTYRLRRIQRVKGDRVSSHIPNTTTAPVTRAADAVEIKPTLCAALFGSPIWSMDIDFTPDRQSDGSLAYPSDNFGNGVRIFLADGIAKASVYRRVGGVIGAATTVTGGAALPIMRNSVRVVSTSTTIAISVNGGPFVSATCPALAEPGTSWTCPIGYTADVGALWGTIGKVAVYAGTALTSRADQSNYVYDNFLRADGPVGQAAYGRMKDLELTTYANTADGGILKRPSLASNRMVIGVTGVAGAASYRAGSVGKPVKEFMARVFYDTGTFNYNSSVPLVATQRDGKYVSDITSGSWHPVFNYSQIDPASFQDVGFEQTAVYNAGTAIPMVSTPGVEQSIGWLRDDRGGIVYILPNQTRERRKVTAAVMALIGETAIPELYRYNGGASPPTPTPSAANTRPAKLCAVAARGG